MNKEVIMDSVRFGTDPEAFVVDTRTGEIVSAIGLIPGNKNKPSPISDKGHAIQTDNVMVEFCVPAANNATDLYKDIQFCLQYINGILPEHLETTIIASSMMDPKYLKNKQARTFGCDPDFNVYSLTQNPSPNAATNLRTAGGHIHVGYKDPEWNMNTRIIQAMDLFLGIPSLILDTDTERRKMYGKAGAYREKVYGVEYRTLSNFWIKSEESVNWAFNQTMRAFEFALNEESLDDETTLSVQLAINNLDLDLACKIAKKYDILLSFEELVIN